jgi:hypothetical protein
LDEDISGLQALVDNDIRFAERESIAQSVRDTDSSTFLLARSRAEAMRWSSELRKSGIKHRLRFGGTPEAVPGWLAIIANSVGKRRITWHEFEAAWKSTAFPQHFEDWTLPDAWLVLDPYKRDGALDCHKVAAAISRYKPPAALARKPVGRGNVTVGTIHGVKGREASHVIISALPKAQNREIGQPGEESRVWFVGLTRASQDLSRIDDWGLWSRTTRNGRPWLNTRNGGKQVLFGLSGDVSPYEGLGVTTQEPNSQGGLASLEFGTSVKCIREKDRYELTVDGLSVATLTTQVERDLYDIRDTLKRKSFGLPREIKHLYCIDVATVSVCSDKAQTLDLKAPFVDTRLWLQPVIVGLTLAYF